MIQPIGEAEVVRGLLALFEDSNEIQKLYERTAEELSKLITN